MAFDFLVPVEDTVMATCALLPSQAIGKNTLIHTAQDGLPVLLNATIAILGVKESRKTLENNLEVVDVSAIRNQFYKLSMGNWNTTIIDLGDIEQGATIEDTYFVVKEVVTKLLEESVIPIILGGTQDLTYAAYRSFDGLKDMINLVSIDSRFDFGMEDELISTTSYMSKIITDKPTNLFNFSNLGYQSYFNAQEEIDLMNRLLFDAYRLGEIANDLSLAEPVLRNAHMVSLDARAIKASEISLSSNFSPNGFTGREICAIARYAGISDKVSIFGIFEMENTIQSQQLIAQIMWYFVEGTNYRVQESPYLDTENFTKYIVPSEEEELIFYKSHLTQRWWIGVPSIFSSHTKANAPALLPCTEKDYLDACNQDIPERWYKAYQKGFN